MANSKKDFVRALMIVLALSAAYFGWRWWSEASARQNNEDRIAAQRTAERDSAQRLKDAEEDAKPLGKVFAVDGGGQIVKLRIPGSGMLGREYRQCVLYRQEAAASLWCEQEPIPRSLEIERD